MCHLMESKIKSQAQTLGGDRVHAITQEAENCDQISITQCDDCYPNKVKERSLVLMTNGLNFTVRNASKSLSRLSISVAPSGRSICGKIEVSVCVLLLRLTRLRAV